MMLLAQNQPSPGAVDVFDPKEESYLFEEQRSLPT